MILRELAVLVLMLAVVGPAGVAIWLWARTGDGTWANLLWMSLVPLVLLVLLGGKIGGRIRTR